MTFWHSDHKGQWWLNSSQHKPSVMLTDLGRFEIKSSVPCYTCDAVWSNWDLILLRIREIKGYLFYPFKRVYWSDTGRTWGNIKHQLVSAITEIHLVLYTQSFSIPLQQELCSVTVKCFSTDPDLLSVIFTVHIYVIQNEHVQKIPLYKLKL